MTGRWPRFLKGAQLRVQSTPHCFIPTPAAFLLTRKKCFFVIALTQFVGDFYFCGGIDHRVDWHMLWWIIVIILTFSKFWMWQGWSTSWPRSQRFWVGRRERHQVLDHPQFLGMLADLSLLFLCECLGCASAIKTKRKGSLFCTSGVCNMLVPVSQRHALILSFSFSFVFHKTTWKNKLTEWLHLIYNRLSLSNLPFQIFLKLVIFRWKPTKSNNLAYVAPTLSLLCCLCYVRGHTGVKADGSDW